MKNLSISLLLMLLLASCSTPEKLQQRKCAKAQIKYEKAAYRWGCPLVQQTDTVIQQMIIRETHDTTIFVRIAADTVYSLDTVTILDGLANSDKSRLDTQYAFSIAYVHESILYHNLFQKESEIAATVKDAIQKSSKVEYKTITRTVTKTTNILTGWQWLQIWAGRICAPLVLIFIILNVILRITKKYFIL